MTANKEHFAIKRVCYARLFICIGQSMADKQTAEDRAVAMAQYRSDQLEQLLRMEKQREARLAQKRNDIATKTAIDETTAKAPNA